MINNDDLEAAFMQIQTIYEDLDMHPTKLIKIGFHNKWNSVFAEAGHAGIAFNFTGNHAVYGIVHDFKPFINLQRFIGKDLFSFTEQLLSLPGIQMRSICLASLNALSQPIISLKNLKSRGISCSSPQDFSFVKREDIVTVVGFGDIINKIKGKCKELHVTDMRPKSSLMSLTVGKNIEYSPKKIYFHDVKENEEIIAKSNIVMMTGSTLVNGTFQEIIKYSSKARIIGIFGPSAQIIPDYLLKCGINYITSSRIVQPQRLFSQLINCFDSKQSVASCMEPYAIEKVANGNYYIN